MITGCLQQCQHLLSENSSEHETPFPWLKSPEYTKLCSSAVLLHSIEWKSWAFIHIVEEAQYTRACSAPKKILRILLERRLYIRNDDILRAICSVTECINTLPRHGHPVLIYILGKKECLFPAETDKEFIPERPFPYYIFTSPFDIVHTSFAFKKPFLLLWSFGSILQFLYGMKKGLFTLWHSHANFFFHLTINPFLQLSSLNCNTNLFAWFLIVLGMLKKHQPLSSEVRAIVPFSSKIVTQGTHKTNTCLLPHFLASLNKVEMKESFVRTIAMKTHFCWLERVHIFAY